MGEQTGSRQSAAICRVRRASQAELVDAGSALPINDVNEFPGVLVELNLQLSFFVGSELCGGVKDATTLALFLVVDVEFAACEVEGLRLGVRVHFTEAELAIGDETNLACGGSGGHSDGTASVDDAGAFSKTTS